MHKLIERVGKLAFERSVYCLKEINKIDKTELSMLGPDWRFVKEWHTQNGTGFLIPTGSTYSKMMDVWKHDTELFLSLTYILTFRFSARQK